MQDDAQTYLNRANAAYQNRSFDDAEALYRKVLELQPGNSAALHNLGVLSDQRGDFDAAADCYREALAANPENANTRRNLASLQFERGDHDESRTLYADLIRTNPNDVDAQFAYSRLTTYTREDDILAALQTASADINAMSPDDKIRLCFALGKAHQDLGEYEAAFEAFGIGNQLHFKRHPYNEAANYAMLEDLEGCINADWLAANAPLDHGDGTPIFVLGMPRSGSTLVEQILASHPDVTAAGEVKYLQQCVQAHLIGDKGTFSTAIGGWTRQNLENTAQDYLERLRTHDTDAGRIVDKLPGNFAFIGLISTLFPNATVVHTTRQPMATIWSNYSTHFGDALYYTYDLEVLGRYYQRYDRMMKHWESMLPDSSVRNVAYEDIVSEPKQTIRTLLESAGLSWDPACLAFHETRRSVRTASVAQVRRPIYESSKEMWRNYRQQLRHIEQALS